MTSKDILNRTSAPAIIRMFDVCFKHGVLDAYNMSDDYSVREFVFKHKNKWTFGVIGEHQDFDWRSFRFVLYRWARENGLTTLAENYIIMIRRMDYHWSLLPYCMWFYLMGAQEWLSYPNMSQIELFKLHTRIHWDPSSPVKKFTRMDYISYLHEACHAYKDPDNENKGASDMAMDSFCEALYDLTREYVKRK